MSGRSPRTRSPRSPQSPYTSPKSDNDSFGSFYHSPGRTSGDDEDESGKEFPQSSRGDLSRSDKSSNNSLLSDRSTSSPSRIYPDLTDCQKECFESPDFENVRNRSRSSDTSVSPPKPKSPKYSKSKNETTTDSSSSLVIVVVCVLILFCALAYLLTRSTSESVNEGTIPPFEYFTGKVDQLKKEFPQQNKRFWTTFKASARHVLMSNEPTYPSVILMASDVDNAQLASCIARKMTSSFESSQGVLPSNSATNLERMKNLDSNTQKKKLDDYLVSALQDNGSKAFVVENLQHLSPEASLLLFKYCDGDNAPFKDVMLVFSLTVEPSVLNLDPDRPDSVEGYLSALWLRGLHQDKVGALMSRVANNIVVLSKEGTDKWTKLCQ